VRAALLLTLVALAGCGSSGDGDGSARFEEDGFDITFEYPEEMKTAGNVRLAAGAGSTAKATEGLRYDKRNVIIVQRYDLSREVQNADDAKPEFDRLVKQLSSTGGAGIIGETGGFPFIDYAGLMVRGSETRLIALFDDDVEYLINCQSTPKRRADIDKACEQVLTTVEKK